MQYFSFTAFFATFFCFLIGSQAAPPKSKVTKSVCKPIGPKTPLFLDGDNVHFNLTHGHDNLLIASNSSKPSGQFQFQQCNVTSVCNSTKHPGCIFPLTPYQYNVFGHVKHLPTGKCLRHNKKHSTFSFEECPKSHKAKSHLPFWFESIIFTPGTKNSTSEILDLAFVGHKHNNAEPKRYYWHNKNVHEPSFALKTQKKIDFHENDLYVHGFVGLD